MYRVIQYSKIAMIKFAVFDLPINEDCKIGRILIEIPY